MHSEFAAPRLGRRQPLAARPGRLGNLCRRGRGACRRKRRRRAPSDDPRLCQDNALRRLLYGVRYGAQQVCHLHDLSRADERRRNASRAGRSKPASREIGQIKTDIKRIIEDVRDAQQDRGVGAVVGVLYNTLLKALETARRRREQEEMEDRPPVLEHALEAAEAARGA
jgi:hypothetical protein